MMTMATPMSALSTRLDVSCLSSVSALFFYGKIGFAVVVAAVVVIVVVVVVVVWVPK